MASAPGGPPEPSSPAGSSSSSSVNGAASNSGGLEKAKGSKLLHIQNLLGYGPGKLVTNWDPSQGEDGDHTEVLPQTMLRIKKDLKEFFSDPVPEVFLVPDPENICVAHSIVIGPADSPYEGGFFYFYVKFPADYPIKPPRVKLLTTNKDTVRFNPNLYRNGKVCLSILGTWSGPGWSPANNLSSVLLSVQSLMNEKPYHNEPGFEEKGGTRHLRKVNGNREDPVEQYNDVIRHETVRVAVIDMMDEANFDTRSMPPALREKIVEVFKKKISHYEKVISDNIELHGKPMKDPFGEPRGTFDYQNLSKKLAKLKEKYPPDEDLCVMGATREYNKIAANHANADDEPNFPNANAKDVDPQGAIDDANYYLDAEGTSGEEDEEEDDDDMHL